MFVAVRWLLVPLLPAVAYLVAAFGAIALSSLVKNLCPSDLLISGMCTATWFPPVELAAIALAVACGAFLFVFLPWLAAPSWKRGVAVLAFGLGAGLASWFTWQVGSSFVAPYIAMLAVGGVTTLALAPRSGNAA